VKIVRDSLLYSLIEKERIKVNTFHHQAVNDISADVRVSATASDGIVEAIEMKDHKFALGVQWHPENMVVSEDSSSINIYKGFIKACKYSMEKV